MHIELPLWCRRGQILDRSLDGSYDVQVDRTQAGKHVLLRYTAPARLLAQAPVPPPVPRLVGAPSGGSGEGGGDSKPVLPMVVTATSVGARSADFCPLGPVLL